MEGNIYIFDSLFLSLGSGQYVIKASHLIEEGNLNASEIIQELENMRKDVNLLFVPFTLEYLKQSGRLPSVVSFVGNMLSIKPICTMEDGKNKIVSKVRGTKQIASKLVDMILELNDGNVEDKIITIGYGSNEDNTRWILYMFTYRTRNFSYKFFLLKNKYIITLSLIDFSNKYFFICNIFDNILKRMKKGFSIRGGTSINV